MNREPADPRRDRWPAAPALSALLLASSMACSKAPAGARAGPSVVLITLDTVRADHLGCYGYGGGTSPHLDAFAQGATRYARAKATAPWTLPSHASLFTGQYPFEHGAHTTWIDPSDADLIDNVRPLSPAADTLAERLAAAGYATAAFAANTVFLEERYGLGQGFETYEVAEGRAPEINARARAWLDARPSDRPFFLFLNYMDAHNPYNTSPRPGWPGGSEDSGPLMEALRELVLPGTGPLPVAELERLRQMYALGIANLDEGLHELFELLRARDLFEPSLIVVASDHGEYFGEHHLIAHSKDVYETVIAVPLIVKAPGQRAGTVEERAVSLAQVPDLMRAHVPALAQVEFSATWPATFVLSENHFTRLKDLKRPWARRFLRSRVALYESDTKLIQSSDGAHELYDLARDPLEARDRSHESPERLRELLLRLEQELARRRAAHPDSTARPLSAEQIEELRALGYF